MKIKKAKKHPVPLSHSNMGEKDNKGAVQDPNVFVPGVKRNGKT